MIILQRTNILCRSLPITKMRFLSEGEEGICRKKNVLISGSYQITSEKARLQTRFRLQSIWRLINYINPPNPPIGGLTKYNTFTLQMGNLGRLKKSPIWGFRG